MTDACDLAAVEARRLIGLKQLSPTELLESCLERIELTNGAVNAFVALDADAARKQAKATEAAIARGEELGLLAGLPIGIKDLQATAGLRTTWGSLLYKDHVPTEDEFGVANIRKAGGVVLGKTNTPEFGAGANTRNRVYGATGNPFDPEKTCGGSSGGSAAALALGQVPLATGSDLGGKPAHAVRLLRHRRFPALAGLVPYVDRAASLSPFSVMGPMGRSVADMHLLLRAQMVPDPRDPFSSGDGARIPARLTGADLGQLGLRCRPISAARRSTRPSPRSSARACARSAPPSARCRSARPTSGRCTRRSRPCAACSSSPRIASAWRARASCSTATSSTTPSAA